MAMIAGQLGSGKTHVLLYLITCLSRRAPLPDGQEPHDKPIRSLIITRDHTGVMILPRLDALGADMRYVSLVEYKDAIELDLSAKEVRGKDKDGNVIVIRRCGSDQLLDLWIKYGQPSLILIDGWTNFIGATNENSNPAVRAVLLPLEELLRTVDLALVLTTSLNKNTQNADTLDRFLGSGECTRIPPLVHQVLPGQDNKFALKNLNSRLGPRAKMLGFEVGQDGSIRCTGEVDDWDGDEEETAVKDNRVLSKVLRAGEFVKAMFKLKAEWDVKELVKEAKKHDISRNSLYRYRDTQDGGRLILSGRKWIYNSAYEGGLPDTSEFLDAFT
jgi:hypothetical protein